DLQALVVPGRACGNCSLCCKLLRIDELKKPAGTWCPHCAPGRGGCKIYPNHPQECQRFYCSWLISDDLGPEWRATTCKVVVFSEGDGNRVAVHVDPGFPDAWQQEPYYSQFKEWSRTAVDEMRQVVVYLRKKAIVILPNKEVDLGEVEPGDQIIVGELKVP